MKEVDRFILLSRVCDQLTKMDHKISPKERQIIMNTKPVDYGKMPDHEELEAQG